MISKLNIILLTVLVLASVSCGDFLKEVSQDEFEPSTTTAYTELLNGEGYSYSTLDALTWYMDDDVDGCTSYTPTKEQMAYKDVFTWQYDMDQSLKEALSQDQSTYENFYAKIMACNVVIDNVENSLGTESEIANVLGEALTLRAYYYFHLVNIFATPYNDARSTPDRRLGVPLVIKSEILDEGYARNTVAEVYKQITGDIERAIVLLEKDKVNNGRFRVNYVAAHLIASRIYLYMEEWDQVIDHATKAMAGAPKLVYLPDYVYNVPARPENSKNPVVSSDFPETIFVYGAMPGSMRFAGTPVCLSDDVVNSYTDNGDSRNGKYFKKTESYLIYPYMELKHGIAERGYVWRTAELYLNRAEAYMQKYKAGESSAGQLAVDDLNELRSNRITNYSDYQLSTAEDLEKLCKLERRRELIFEGHRWFDLRRYGMPQIQHKWIADEGKTTTYTLSEKDPSYTVPIPQAVLDRNKNLVQNELAPDRQGY
ncbi:RagB/SusD family nutrient uptake outer membrane protein [Butyricimonas sp.]|uniref:RagB/SusD family nutrient uptake outer membrane protein n=1 Tax=Butyricimonas sp. TaxID=1969738 RepID=UPI0025C4E8A9|nr:RagB/SusD family nutrient uptake outer membrane protein [Butyricimonas sp.]